MLDAAGYPLKDGVRFELTLQGPRGRYLNDANVVQAIGQYLSDVGVKTTVDLQDWATYSPKLPKHQVGPLFFLGTGGDVWSALYDMADISAPDAETNYTNWNDPEWFKLWAQVNAERDPAKQKQIINQMLQIMYDDSPWLFLYMQPDFYAASNRITWTAQPDKIYLYTAALKK
jgi:peptide/nickel transport system substrate-binding protein